MTTHTQSVAEIEHDVETQRAGIAHTLDEISTRLTPGQLLDETWAFARGSGGGAFVRNLGASARDNPLPVGLIAAGIAWLISGRNGAVPGLGRDRHEDHFRTGAFESGYRPDLDTSLRNGSGLPAEKDDETGMLQSAAQSTTAAAGAVRDGLSHTAGVVGDMSRIAAEDAMDGAERLRRSALDQGRRLGTRAREAGREAQARASNFADEQPVLLAAAGVALGALVGALVRSTSTESRLVGEASDRVKDRAMDLAERGFEHGAEMVERTHEAVRDEAGKQGLTPSAARSAANDLTDKVTKVAKKGRAKLEEEIGAATSGDDAPRRD